MGRTALESLQGPLTHLDLANPEARIALLHATGILDFADPNCQFPPTGENKTSLSCFPKWAATEWWTAPATGWLQPRVTFGETRLEASQGIPLSSTHCTGGLKHISRQRIGIFGLQMFSLHTDLNRLPAMMQAEPNRAEYIHV